MSEAVKQVFIGHMLTNCLRCTCLEVAAINIPTAMEKIKPDTCPSGCCHGVNSGGLVHPSLADGVPQTTADPVRGKERVSIGVKLAGSLH